MAQADDWRLDVERKVEVEIPSKELDWFATHREYPVEASIQQRTRRVRIGDRELRYHPLDNGNYSVTVGSRTVSIGEFNAETVYHTISPVAARDVRVVRAVVLNLPYEVAVALKLTDGTLIHPGACWLAHRDANPRAQIIERITDLPDDDVEGEDDGAEHARCVHCEGSFE